jgi:hypothetical protein
MAVAEKSVVAAETAAAVAITEVAGASEVLAAETSAHMPATKTATTEVAAAKAAMGHKHGGSAAKSTTHMATPAATTATTTCQCVGRNGSASQRDRRDNKCDLMQCDVFHWLAFLCDWLSDRSSCFHL